MRYTHETAGHGQLTPRSHGEQVNALSHLITTRRISLGLILMVAGLVSVSTMIPQSMDSTPAQIEAWRQAHPGVIRIVDMAGLHQMYGQTWFTTAVLLSGLAMGVSSYNQLVLSRRRLYSGNSSTGEEVASAVPEQLLRAVARSHHYRPLRTESVERLKFVRNPWGYFGSLLLHLGMTLVVFASLYVSLTGRQGSLIMVEGEERGHQHPWDLAEQGAWAAPLRLPGTVRLDRVRVNFDAKNQPQEVLSELSITTEPGQVEAITASINRIAGFRGMRIYHASQYGTAFTVEFTDNRGTVHTERIYARQPANLTTAGYSDEFGVDWSNYRFAAKYFADGERKSMQHGTPQLTIRMLDGSREVGRTIVPPGNTSPLGEYHLRLVETKRWAKLIMVDNSGMPAIFTGFAIIMLGGMLHYLFPPRELTALAEADGNYRVRWKATAFAEFFADERELLARHLRREKE
jgi:hypothetical protein